VTEPELQYGSVNFLVYLFNSFEQVPVPGVTENRYLAVRRTRGWLSEGRNLVLERTKFSSSTHSSILCCKPVQKGLEAPYF
jgi:hypothetical protein